MNVRLVWAQLQLLVQEERRLLYWLFSSNDSRNLSKRIFHSFFALGYITQRPLKTFSSPFLLAILANIGMGLVYHFKYVS
ncbi:unnamed protein product [Arctogadus glacialis]